VALHHGTHLGLDQCLLLLCQFLEQGEQPIPRIRGQGARRLAAGGGEDSFDGEGGERLGELAECVGVGASAAAAFTVHPVVDRGYVHADAARDLALGHVVLVLEGGDQLREVFAAVGVCHTAQG